MILKYLAVCALFFIPLFCGMGMLTASRETIFEYYNNKRLMLEKMPLRWEKTKKVDALCKKVRLLGAALILSALVFGGAVLTMILR